MTRALRVALQARYCTTCKARPGYSCRDRNGMTTSGRRIHACRWRDLARERTPPQQRLAEWADYERANLRARDRYETDRDTVDRRYNPTG